MPRPLVLGNGSILAAYDQSHSIREFFYPHVGHRNHLLGNSIRLAVFVDGTLEWLGSSDFPGVQAYRDLSLVSHSTFQSKKLEIEVVAVECAVPNLPVLIRKLTLRNLADHPRKVRVFSTQVLHINESDIGNTAFYEPSSDTLFHYKDSVYFLFAGRSDAGGICQFATGLNGFGGYEGTWRDAEDGELSGNPIAQGSVDSTFGVDVDLPASGSSQVNLWIACGSKMIEAEHHHDLIQERGVDAWIDETDAYWRAWSNASEGLSQDLPAPIADFARRSLLIMRTQIDDQGAIIAANDSDIMSTNRSNYSYMWPRDGSLASWLFDRAGYPSIGGRFLNFCSRIIDPRRPVLLQKYTSDGALGASWHPWIHNGKPEIPFQEDESALTLIELQNHFRGHGDIEILAPFVPTLLIPMADFMVRHRDDKTGLPNPSYDLWEERRGIHAFTVAAVVAGLTAAADLAKVMGSNRASTYLEVAQQMSDALFEHLYDSERGCFFRRLKEDDDGSTVPDTTIDASTLMIGLLDPFDPNDKRIVSNAKVVEEALTVHSEIGGVARYNGDYYFRRSDAYPGNPWIICAMWLAQYQIATAKALDGLDAPRKWLEWAMKWAAPTGVLPEQIHPETGEPLSVSPLTWSHAEFVHTALDWAAKSRQFRTTILA